MPHKIILIGASTGGPGRLHTILENLPHNFDATIIIAQHMISHFIPSFVKQLSSITPLEVKGVFDGMEILPSSVYICSGECQLIEKRGGIQFVHNDPSSLLYSPDVNTLFLSVAKLSGSIQKMGIILTGIGDDGALGSKALFEAGGRCMFESEESAAVYGMPRCAIELVPQADVGSMPQIIQAIRRFGENRV
ncbi:MAG: CheB methylesterase domain-containing protein [Campylobacterales bacterium]|nr:CheB methylesterase domain-containing protein [Campylobacterales bacterium]